MTIAAAAPDQTAPFARAPAATAVWLHALLWTLVPASIIGGLHQDTLEAAYWGNDLAFGYARHPPLPSWLIDAVLRAGGPPILSLLALSQIGMAVAACYVWKAARLLGGATSAAVAVALFLVSLSTTFYGVQLNHNSLLAPFWAAAIFYGLSWLETRGKADAAAFGAACGLGMLVKYEMAVIGACLLAIALAVPRYRPALREPGVLVAAAVGLAILAPHLLWLAQSDGEAVAYALGTHKMTDLASAFVSAGNLLTSQALLFIFPVVMLLVLARSGLSGRRRPAGGETARIGAILAFGPSLGLLATTIATAQIAKPLWALPFTSSCALGLALLLAFDDSADADRTIARRTQQASLTLLGAFVAYLFIADAIGAAIGKPLTFYAADTRQLGEAVDRLWTSQERAPLQCVAIADDVLAASTVLWLKSRPHYVDFNQPQWSRPGRVARCRETGGVAILTGRPQDKYLLAALPDAAPRVALSIPAAFGFSHTSWRVELIHFAPGRPDARWAR